MDALKKLWRDYSLGVVLAVLWLGSWVAYALLLAAYHAHPDSYALEFWSASLENIQSENYQTLMMVLVTWAFIFKGSAESKDSDERMEKKLDQILKKLDK